MMRRPFIFIPALLALFSCTQELPDTPYSATSSGEEHTGVILVKLSEELTTKVEADFTKGNFLATKSDPVNAALSGIGAVRVERLFEDGGEWEPRHREFGLHRFYRVVYDPSVSATKAAGTLESIEGVISTEREPEIQTDGFFNDPRLGEQWHLVNSSYTSADVDCLPVWQKYTCGSSSVTVAVIDGGVDTSHVDIGPVVIPAGPKGSKNFVDNSYNIVPHRHGTHVGGIIGAINNNGTGGCGIAGGNDGNGGVRILSCQVFKTVNGSDRSYGQYSALVWAADHGAVLANNSWSIVYSSAAAAASGSAGYYADAIDYFIKYAGCDNKGNQLPDSPMKGGLVFFSAGNKNWPDGWPAEYAATQPNCIAVGAYGLSGEKSYYSTYGDWVTLCAPGGDARVDNMILSTVPTNGYAYMQGTSQSCPNATGVAALVLSYYGGQGFTNSMLREKLVKGARQTENTISSKIGPKVDAYKALTYGMNLPPVAVGTIRSSSTAESITLSWTVTADSKDGKATGYLALFSKNSASLDGINPAALPEDVISVDVKVGDIALGKWIKAKATGLASSTKYYYVVIGYDKEGLCSDPSKKAFISTKAGSNPPVLSSTYADDGKVKADGVLNIDFTATDSDNNLTGVKLVSGEEDATLIELSAGNYRLSIAGGKSQAGKHSATVRATDATGLTAEKTFAYEILGNSAPVISVTKENNTNWLISVSDPDGDSFGFDFAPGSAAATSTQVSDSSWRMTVSESSGVTGRFTARCTATDTNGSTATYSIPYTLQAVQ